MSMKPEKMPVLKLDSDKLNTDSNKQSKQTQKVPGAVCQALF